MLHGMSHGEGVEYDNGTIGAKNEFNMFWWFF